MEFSKNKLYSRLCFGINAELLVLALFFFFLPYKEAPKNIFLFIYFLFWTWGRWKSGNWGKYDWKFDTPLLLVGLLGIVSSLVAASDVSASLLNGIDFWSIAFLGIMLRRSPWCFDRMVTVIISATTLGIAVSLIEGIWLGFPFPSLKSVGHVNHVAVFLVVYFFIALSGLTAARTRSHFWVLFALGTVAMALGFMTISRNAVFAIGLMVPMLFLLAIRVGSIDRKIIFSGILLILIGALVVVSYAPGLYRKQILHLAKGGVDVERIKVWRAGLEAFNEKPLLGHGVGTFAVSTGESEIRRLIASQSRSYEPSLYLHTNHGHNLWLNWAVERGILAVLVLGLWLAYLLAYSVKASRQCAEKFSNRNDVPASDPREGQRGGPFCLYLLFTGALGVVLLGVWNTTLHHEHGLLAMATIALGYSRLSKIVSVNS